MEERKKEIVQLKKEQKSCLAFCPFLTCQSTSGLCSTCGNRSTYRQNILIYYISPKTIVEGKREAATFSYLRFIGRHSGLAPVMIIKVLVHTSFLIYDALNFVNPAKRKRRQRNEKLQLKKTQKFCQGLCPFPALYSRFRIRSNCRSRCTRRDECLNICYGQFRNSDI